MQPIRFVIPFLSLVLLSSAAAALEVNIIRDVGQFTVRHGDRQVTVMRNQDTTARLEGDFALTSRPCPPFCAQPMQAAEGVATIGEVELVQFMRTRLADGSGLLIDARTPKWHRRGTIPGSINIPYTRLNRALGADEFTVEDTLTRLGAEESADGWDFSKAKHLVLWCNGPWCGQSPAAIRGLIELGYPASKLQYYRGGMQLWRIFGLPVVDPEGRVLDE